MSISAKQFFQDGFLYAQRVQALTERLKHLRANPSRGVPCYSSDPRSTMPSSPVESVIVRCEELEQEIAAEQERLDGWRKIADRIIPSLPDGRMRDILTWRYIRLRNWNAISEELLYSRSQVFRLHARALEEAQTILDATFDSNPKDATTWDA